MASMIFLLLAAITWVAAAPAPPLYGHELHGRVVSSVSCVNSTPAYSTNDSTSLWPFAYAQVPTTQYVGQDFDIDPTWAAAHQVTDMQLSMTSTADQEMDEYAAFKCQFSCNSNVACISFFGRYVDIGQSTEHFDCTGYDALLDGSQYVLTSGTVPVGGFDVLCLSSAAAGSSKRSTIKGKGVARTTSRDLDDGAKLRINDGEGPCLPSFVDPDSSQNLTAFYPNMNFQTSYEMFWTETAAPENSTGFIDVFFGCSHVCASTEGCLSVFTAYGKPDPAHGFPGHGGPTWICMFFNAPLTEESYTGTTRPESWEDPQGWNIDCQGN